MVRKQIVRAAHEAVVGGAGRVERVAVRAIFAAEECVSGYVADILWDEVRLRGDRGVGALVREGTSMPHEPVGREAPL